MRRVNVVVAMLTVGALALGAGVSLAATGASKAPEASKASAVSNAPATPANQEAKETKVVQQSDKAQATRQKGEKEVGVDRIVRGEVTAVEPTAKTLTIKFMRGKEAQTIGVEVPETAKIMQGKAAKTLGDIKIGDRVRMKYDRTNDKLVADQIRILRPGKMASKSASSGKSS